MSDVLEGMQINTFGSKSPKADFVQPSEDPILEIPLSEFQAILADLTLTFNLLSETLRDRGILRGRELARMTTEASNSVKATRSPTENIRVQSLDEGILHDGFR